MVAVTQNPLADITGSSGWGCSFTLAQCNDLQTGKLLEHPIVRRIRVNGARLLLHQEKSGGQKPAALSVCHGIRSSADSCYVVFLNSHR